MGRKRGWLRLLDSNSHGAFNSILKFRHRLSTSQPNLGGTRSQTQGNHQENFILISHRIFGHRTAFWAKNLPAFQHLRKMPSQAAWIPPRTESALQSTASATEQTLTQLAAHESTCKRSCARLFSWFEKEKEMSEKILQFLVVPSQVISLFYSYLGQEERGKTKTKLLYITASSPSLPASCRSWRAGTTPGWHQEGQLLCGALLQLREEKGPRTYPGDSSFHLSIQGKSSLGPELLVATEPRLNRKVSASTGFQKLHFHSYHPPPNPAAAFVAAFVRTLLQMKTDE